MAHEPRDAAPRRRGGAQSCERAIEDLAVHLAPGEDDEEAACRMRASLACSRAFDTIKGPLSTSRRHSLSE